MNTNLFISSICLFVLYIYAGYDKIQDVNGTAKSLHNKLSMFPMNLCILAIWMVIILNC